MGIAKRGASSAPAATLALELAPRPLWAFLLATWMGALRLGLAHRTGYSLGLVLPLARLGGLLATGDCRVGRRPSARWSDERARRWRGQTRQSMQEKKKRAAGTRGDGAGACSSARVPVRREPCKFLSQRSACIWTPSPWHQSEQRPRFRAPASLAAEQVHGQKPARADATRDPE